MAILFVSPIDNFNIWKQHLHKVDSQLDIRSLDNVGEPDEILMILAWKPPTGIFPRFKKLKLIQSLGMGVDHLLECRDLPKMVAISRIIDADMGMQMAEYVLYGILHHHRRMHAYKMQQMNSIWNPLSMPTPKGSRIGIMGFGELGKIVAKSIHMQGFPVSTWSNSPKITKDYQMYFGKEALSNFLKETDILVNLLPLTTETKHILNRNTLYQLPKGAFLINPARGNHLVEKDLLDALSTGQIAGALLDVFEEEPLPSNHPFWLHPQITLTPHIAANTNPETSSEQIVENYHLIKSDKKPINQVDIIKQY